MGNDRRVEGCVVARSMRGVAAMWAFIWTADPPKLPHNSSKGKDTGA